MRETQEREVTLSDCHPDTLEAVLQFCYMGECRRPKKDMLALLVMADRLDIPCLTALCEKVRERATLQGAASEDGCIGGYKPAAASHVPLRGQMGSGPGASRVCQARAVRAGDGRETSGCMVQVVLGNINQDTFGDFLDVASSHRLERLEAKCIDYLLANFNKVAYPLSWSCPFACIIGTLLTISVSQASQDAGLGGSVSVLTRNQSRHSRLDAAS